MSNTNKTASSTDPLVRLFRAYREQNNTAFRKAAESIIAEELAANHHSFAKELRAALGPADPASASRPSGGLTPISRNKTTSNQLLTIYHEPASTQHLYLDKDTRRQIDRVIDERRNSAKLARFGYAPKSKLLFWGPPGCGKTLTAHFLANEFNLKLGVVRLSSVISSLLGDTASRIQQIFDSVQETPMVLLFDEIDAVAKTRDDVHDVGELKRVVNSLLQAMDTFVAIDSLLIGASNHQYMLDPAIWRRFDDVIAFPKPTPEVRSEYIAHQLNGVSFAFPIAKITKSTAGMSFAEIEHVITEAVKTMILSDRKELILNDLTEQLSNRKRISKATNQEQTEHNE